MDANQDQHWDIPGIYYWNRPSGKRGLYLENLWTSHGDWITGGILCYSPRCFRRLRQNLQQGYHQWEFQDPKMEVPTIYKAYIRPM